MCRAAYITDSVSDNEYYFSLLYQHSWLVVEGDSYGSEQPSNHVSTGIYPQCHMLQVD